MTRTVVRTTVYRLEYDFARLNSDLNGQEVYPISSAELTYPVNLPNGRREMTAPLAQWLTTPVEFSIPQPVEFKGFFPTLLETDWPESKGDIPLFRRCLIDALRAAGDFSHRVITARITDDVAAEGCPPGYVIGQTTDDYALLHITDHLDVLDMERSTYREYWPEANSVLGLREPVLVPRPEGFPPAFRLIKNPEPLLISEAGRQALLTAEIRGISLEPFWEG